MKTTLKINTNAKDKKEQPLKVAVGIAGIKGNNFKNGKGSIWFRVYDATPDEVLERIAKALQE